MRERTRRHFWRRMEGGGCGGALAVAGGGIAGKGGER